MNNLVKRIITALLLIAVAVGAAVTGLQYFIYLVHIFVFMLQIELAMMFFKGDHKIIRYPFITVCFFSTILYNYMPFYFSPFLFLTIPIFLSLLMVFYSDKSNEEIVKLSALCALGFLYVGLLPSLTTKILMVQNGAYWMLVCLGVVFSGDVGAYFIGSRFGKNKLIPQISPNKTWEGALGGVACSMLFSLALGKYFFPNISMIVLVLSGCLAALLAQAGDFFESMLKRVAGQKDSGKFLPGHGGFLDRFDGLLFAIPVYYYLAIY